MTSDHMQGRIIALEIMVRGLILEMAKKADDPAETLSRWRDDAVKLMAGFQASDGAIQSILSEASKTLTESYGQVEHQLRRARQR